MELIDKSKLLEGLKKLKQNLSASPIVVIEDVESLVESLEPKEVDLEEEIKKIYLKHRQYSGNKNILVILNELQFNDIAKYFFELGLKANESKE